MKIPLMLLLFLLPMLVQAAPLLPKVEWSQRPLWSLLKFYPGDSQQAAVVVSNNDISTHRIYLEFNDIKDGGLMGGVELSVGGKVISITETNDLGEISGGTSSKIPITLKFKYKSGNQYKDKSLSLLTCIRFELGAKACTPNSIVVDAQGGSGNVAVPSAGSSRNGGSRENNISTTASSIAAATVNSSVSIPPPKSLFSGNSRLSEGETLQYQEMQSLGKKTPQVEDDDSQKFDDPNSEEAAATGETRIAMGAIVAIMIIVVVLGRLIIA